MTCVLDGEVAVYDQQLRYRFDWLREPDPDAVASPPLYMAFDILYRDGRHLTARPLRERRPWLEDVVACGELVFPVRRLARTGWGVEAGAGARVRGAGDRGRGSRYESGPRRRWVAAPPDA